LHAKGQQKIWISIPFEGEFFMTEVIVAVIALAGTAIGSLGGILAASRLMNYRIEQLEKKVDKHNNVVERIAVVEVKISDQALELKRIHQALNVE
jgi:hypothetical protein